MIRESNITLKSIFMPDDLENKSLSGHCKVMYCKYVFTMTKWLKSAAVISQWSHEVAISLKS